MANDKLCLLSMSIIYPFTDRKDVFYLWLRGCCKSNKTERTSAKSSAIPELGCGAEPPCGAKQGPLERRRTSPLPLTQPGPHTPINPPVPCAIPFPKSTQGDRDRLGMQTSTSPSPALERCSMHLQKVHFLGSYGSHTNSPCPKDVLHEPYRGQHGLV